jgi:kynurenine formamidase
MGKAATLWILERGVRLVGTDGWRWDAPFSLTRKKSRRDRRRRADLGGPPRRPRDRLFPPGKLHNLEQLPSDGFEVVCFPVKVHRASAGWTRAVAILPR